VWNKDATLCLLRLYGDMKPKFGSPRYKNCMLWRELAALLQKEGFSYTAEQVEGRWKTLLAAYRRVVDHNNTSGNDRKDFDFMSEMKDILADNPSMQPQCTISSAEGMRHLPTTKTKSKRKSPYAAPTRNVKEAPSPSTSAGAGSPVNTDDTDSSVSTGARKRKRVAKKQDVMTWLDSYQSQQATAEENRLELARRIHSDNMAVMSGLLDILKQVVNKK